jgi:hypothetical protein
MTTQHAKVYSRKDTVLTHEVLVGIRSQLLYAVDVRFSKRKLSPVANSMYRLLHGPTWVRRNGRKAFQLGRRFHSEAD